MGTEGTSIEGDRLSFEFMYNGRSVRAYSGDSVASALVRSGVHVFSRSMKFHRPRGLYCGASRCYSCVMRVNGVPGVRTCATRAEAGMVVESEGGFPTTNTDFLSVLDHMFRHEFDYQKRFIRPRFMVPLYQRIVRRFASPRSLPDKQRQFHPLERIDTEVLIVGHGISGTSATDKLRSLGVNPLIADRHGTDVFTPTIAFGIYEEGKVGLLTETGGMLVRAKAILLATGKVQTGLDVTNADIPGVMLPEAVEHLVDRGVRPGSKAFIIGDNELRGEVLKNLSRGKCEVIGETTDPKAVVRVIGSKTVTGIEVADSTGKRTRSSCDLVVLLGPLVPYVSLAQQAGCGLRSDGPFWFVEADQAGRTSVPNVFACGSVTGARSSSDRADSGEGAAMSIAKFLGVK